MFGCVLMEASPIAGSPARTWPLVESLSAGLDKPVLLQQAWGAAQRPQHGDDPRSRRGASQLRGSGAIPPSQCSAWYARVCRGAQNRVLATGRPNGRPVARRRFVASKTPARYLSLPDSIAFAASAHLLPMPFPPVHAPANFALRTALPVLRSPFH